MQSRGRPPPRRDDAPAVGRELRAPTATSREQAVLALQTSAGNAAVGWLLRQPAGQARKTAKPAGAAVRSRFSATARQALQVLIGGQSADGGWNAGWDDSLERFKTRHRITSARGTVDMATLDALVAEAVAQSMQTEVIHLVAEFFQVDTSDMLSLRFDPQLNQLSGTVGFGGLDSARIGSPAMASAAAIKAALDEIIATRMGSSSGPLPFVRMTRREAERAARQNSSTLRSDRAIRIIQALLDEEPTGRLTSDTARRIADFQTTNVPADAANDPGILTTDTFKAMVDQLVAQSQLEPAIRLVIDWYQLDDRGPMDVAFDLALTTDFKIQSANRPGPALITFGQAAFVMGHEGLVHAIEQAYVEARARAAGLSDDQGQFLGFRARVLSPVADDFATNASTIMSLGFVRDARLALDAFQKLPPTVRQKRKSQFESLRTAVENRFATADPQEQKDHAELLKDYRDVTL